MQVVVLGAAGQLGREVVRALVARGHAVCAAVRRPPVPAFDSSMEVRLADARNKTEILAAISGFDAVINVIGGGTLRRNDVASTTIEDKALPVPRRTAKVSEFAKARTNLTSAAPWPDASFFAGLFAGRVFFPFGVATRTNRDESEEFQGSNESLCFCEAGFQQDFIGALRGNRTNDLFHSLNVADVSPWYSTQCLSK